MTIIINAGSQIPETSDNTYERAQERAHEWLNHMRSDGLGDIEVIDTGEEKEGRWRFIFRHCITGVEVNLDQHGVEDDGLLFPLRVYWNGSSSSEPSIDDFKAPGFVKTFRGIGD